MNTLKSRSMLMPIVLGCLLTMSSSACDSRSPIMPGTPTTPSAPTSPDVPTVTLSGTIVERFSGQPIQGVRVALFPRTYPTRPFWSWPPGGGYRGTPSDAGGRYANTGIPNDFGSFFVMASYAHGTYAQQCLTTVTLHSDANQNVTLTSSQNRAAGNSLRPPPVPGTRTISGMVFEITPVGRQPIEGAWVGFTVDPSGDVTGAETFSDASGRYLLCGLPETQLTSLFAVKNGYLPSNWLSVDAGSDTTLDLELKR